MMVIHVVKFVKCRNKCIKPQITKLQAHEPAQLPFWGLHPTYRSYVWHSCSKAGLTKPQPAHSIPLCKSWTRLRLEVFESLFACRITKILTLLHDSPTCILTFCLSNTSMGGYISPQHQQYFRSDFVCVCWGGGNQARDTHKIHIGVDFYLPVLKHVIRPCALICKGSCVLQKHFC